MGEIEKDKERYRESQRPGGNPALARDPSHPTYCPPPRALAQALGCFSIPNSPAPGAAVQAETVVSPEEGLSGQQGHSGLCGGWGEGTEVCLTVQVALTDPGCILSMDKLVAAASHQLRGSHVHMVANSGGVRKTEERKRGKGVRDIRRCGRQSSLQRLPGSTSLQYSPLRLSFPL